MNKSGWTSYPHIIIAHFYLPYFFAFILGNKKTVNPIIR